MQQAQPELSFRVPALGRTREPEGGIGRAAQHPFAAAVALSQAELRLRVPVRCRLEPRRNGSTEIPSLVLRLALRKIPVGSMTTPGMQLRQSHRLRAPKSAR